MSFFRLLLAEMGYRPLNVILSLLAVVAAATLFVGGPTLLAGYRADTKSRLEKIQAETDTMLADMDQRTIRLMRDLGFNLLIVHRDTDMSDFYGEFKALDMPQEYVYRLANAPDLTKVAHLVATLQQRIAWNDRKVLLVGVLPEVAQAHAEGSEKKAPMGYNIKPGTVLLGKELGGDHKPGEKINVQGHEFTIEQILPEQGTTEDIMIAMHLSDAQKVLNKPDTINQILAINCKCKVDRLGEIRSQLENALPEAKVTEQTTKAIARAEQRKLVANNRAELLAQLDENRGRTETMLTTLRDSLVPLVVLISAVFVGLMSWNNVRERRPEIGVLRALGKGAGHIAGLFLGKAILLGLLGGLVGCGLGYVLAQTTGARMEVPADYFRPDVALLVATVVGAPVVAAMATYLPALLAIRQDPAIVLRDM